jgi:1-acyl-sn-glycerol-3-phosphate acyltransferase
MERLDVPFGQLGSDPFGISRPHLARLLTALGWLYRRYHRVRVQGLEHIPMRGRAMLVGNHSGGIPLDAGMVIAAAFFDLEPPRLVQGMVERFVSRLPVLSSWATRTGQLPGLPEHATQLLAAERLLMVFPEGARGSAKLFPKRNSLIGFGTGFLRLALQMSCPIVPFGFVGGGEAVPTIVNLRRLGRLVGIPYLPVTPYGLPVPLPVRLDVRFGAPLQLDGSGDETDDVIVSQVDQVKHAIATLQRDAMDRRRSSPPPPPNGSYRSEN